MGALEKYLAMAKMGGHKLGELGSGIGQATKAIAKEHPMAAGGAMGAGGQAIIDRAMGHGEPDGDEDDGEDGKLKMLLMKMGIR